VKAWLFGVAEGWVTPAHLRAKNSAGVPSDQIYMKNNKYDKHNQPKIACSAGV
jgi:hypothetical protein